MAMNGIVNSINTKLRMTGMVSGLDVDTLVTQLTAADTAKIDKVKQQRELALWKTEAYRDISTVLQGFNTSFFDVLQATNNLKFSGSFASFTSSYSKADITNYFTATAVEGAKSGTYSVSDIKKATAAIVNSTGNVSAAITGVSIADITKISSLTGSNKFKVVLNGETKEIVINNNENLSDLRDDLQNKIDFAFGGNKIKVIKDDVNNSLSFDTERKTDTFSIGPSYNTGISDIMSKDLSKGLTTTAYNNKFDLTYGTEKKTIVLPIGKTYKNTDEVIADIQSFVNNDTTGFGNGTVYFTNDKGKIQFSVIEEHLYPAVGGLADIVIPPEEKVTIDNTNKSMVVDLGTGTDFVISIDPGKYTRAELMAQVQSKLDKNPDVKAMNLKASINFSSKLEITKGVYATATDNGTIEALGFKDSNKSNKLDTTVKLSEIKNTLDIPFAGGTADANGNDISFKINNTEFKFNSSKVSINDIINTVNVNADANVVMKYNYTDNTFSVESKNTGAAQRITNIQDINGNLMESLKLKGLTDEGSDASITINGTQKIVRSTNSFVYDGIAYNIKGDYADDAGTFTLTSDPQKVIDMMKEFVKKYNEIIDKINSKITEKKDTNYAPLTDAQKEAMSEEQIKVWETKAKAGLLRNDSTLSDITSRMRNALMDSVQGVGISLRDIGITTSSTYSDKGKLVLDEQKLKDAITNNPDAIAKLFTKESDVSYYDILDGTGDSLKRYNEEGLGQRLSDIIQDTIRTSTDKYGQKGSLLVIAGITGDRSEYNSQLYNQVTSYDSQVKTLLQKLSDRQEHYYNKFAALETAMNKMSAQSNWLAAQFNNNR